MKLSFEVIVGLVLLLALVVVPNATAQTVISNETLVTTTFVANEKSATAKCGSAGCRANTPMFAAIPVTCPAALGLTCTFHILLNAKTSVRLCSTCIEPGPAGPGFYQFLIDGVAPTIGPTEKDGTYLFEKNVVTYYDLTNIARLVYSASVLTTVTNSSSQNHTIIVKIGCAEKRRLPGGCEATSQASTMRVDVFEP